MAGKVEIARIEHRRGAGQALQNRGFEIVDHDFGRHTQGGEAVFVAGEEMLHGLGEVNSTNIWRLNASTMTKNESRRRVLPTATVP